VALKIIIILGPIVFTDNLKQYGPSLADRVRCLLSENYQLSSLLHTYTFIAWNFSFLAEEHQATSTIFCKETVKQLKLLQRQTNKSRWTTLKDPVVRILNNSQEIFNNYSIIFRDARRQMSVKLTCFN
jgi:hypothetical protein